jgi:Zinc finger, C2H2 type
MSPQPTSSRVPGHAFTANPIHSESLPMENPYGTGNCPIPTCHQSCSRQQELERHVKEHLPRFLACPRRDCPWRGNRVYLLQDHWRKRHAGIPTPGTAEITIYDPKDLAKRLINREIDIAQANDMANFLVRERAMQLGKQDLWDV